MKFNWKPRKCPVCESLDSNVLGIFNYSLFDDLKIPGNKMLLICKNCGMLYDKVKFLEPDLDSYYFHNAHYAFSNEGGTGGVSQDNNERYERILSVLLPSKRGIILDYGCGQGGFVNFCVKKGLNCIGIEPSKYSRLSGISLGLSIYKSLEEYLLDKISYHYKISSIVLSHTIEHMLNPLSLLKKLMTIAPDALFYIEVPDAANYINPNFVKWNEFFFEHLCHFRMNDLQNLANAAGMKTIKIAKIPFSRKQSNIQCIFFVGEADNLKKNIIPSNKICSLPRMPEFNFIKRYNALALWGVSQYAMLLLGSYYQFRKKVRYLFDSSPAKIGRRINGIKIASSQKISSLPKEIPLLIPKSAFTNEMLNLLPQIGFYGDKFII